MPWMRQKDRGQWSSQSHADAQGQIPHRFRWKSEGFGLPDVHQIWGFPKKWGYPTIFGVSMGKSHQKMDDDWGVAHKSDHETSLRCPEGSGCHGSSFIRVLVEVLMIHS